MRRPNTGLRAAGRGIRRQHRPLAVRRRGAGSGRPGGTGGLADPGRRRVDLVGDLERLSLAAPIIDEANAEVVRRLDQSVPLLVGRRGRPRTSSPACPDRTLLHCGPAIEWADVCDPLRRSMRAATVAEGWAESVEEATDPRRREL